jgi:hypothetical protein
MSDDSTPSPKKRALQRRIKGLGLNLHETNYPINPKVRMKLGSVDNDISNKKLWDESQDPCLQAVWEELRLENYAGRIVSEIIEFEDDPDIIEAQRARKGS